MKQLNTHFITILIWAACLSQAILVPSFAMDTVEKQRKIRLDEDEADFVEKKLQFLHMDIANMKIMATIKDPDLQEQIYSDAQKLIQELCSPNNSLSDRPVEINRMLRELSNLVDQYLSAYNKRRNQTELEPAAIYLPKERGDIEDTLKSLEQEIAELEQTDFSSHNSEQLSQDYDQAYVLHNKVMKFFDYRGNYLDQTVQNRLKAPITFIKNSLRTSCELLRQQETNTPKASSKNIHDPIQEKLNWFRRQSDMFVNDVGSDFYELLTEVTECKNEFSTFLDHNTPHFNETHRQMATNINEQFDKATEDLQLLINMKEMEEQEMQDQEPEQDEDEFITT